MVSNNVLVAIKYLRILQNIIWHRFYRKKILVRDCAKPKTAKSICSLLHKHKFFFKNLVIYLPKNYAYLKTILKLMTQHKFDLNWQYVMKILLNDKYRFPKQYILRCAFLNKSPFGVDMSFRYMQKMKFFADCLNSKVHMSCIVHSCLSKL